ncbi:MAG: DEAD/DEAH box helicase [Nitrospirae bacterium]|nr:DEAD/DEAH box helicase [Nitrospirota bacterium]
MESFHPLITKWFSQRFGGPTEAQRLGWPSILEGRDTLIAAPTGSGKTLAAFLACLDRLVRDGISGELTDRTHVVYVSPLKALSNDVQRNLEVPLTEIRKLAHDEGIPLPEIRVLVRTGDTPASERLAMTRRPPHILVTTPESLYLLLTAEKSRKILRTVETVIVDEIHAVARDKRGSHLALSISRLEHLCDRRPVRIGLSATQRPIEEMARFLVGTRRMDVDGRPDCAIVDVGHLRELDLAIETPRTPLSAVCSNEQWKEVYERVAELIKQHRSTLIFVNTRRLAERVTHQLSDLLGEDAVASHHGSLSKKIRLAAEARLKAGELKAVVATASLELGIDIGFIDLVIQVGSPRAIATFLQRIGRSGHALGVVPKGRLFALTRDELLECAALIRAVRAKRLDRIEIPKAPLDILAQQIVAASACEEWSEDEMFSLVRGAYPYRDLSRSDFEAVIEMLSEGFSTRTGRFSAYLYRDGVHHRVKARRGARLTALTSGGAIPERADYKVVAEPEHVTVGSVDEDFAVESMSGDVFLLGNTSWRIQHVRGGEVVVADAHGAAPTIPFWRGEAPSRTVELSQEVSALREEIEKRLQDPKQAVGFLVNECAMGETNAKEAVEYLSAQKAAVGMIPTQSHLLIERSFDESGGMELVIHSPFGGRINRALGLTLRKRFCRRFDFELQASADDNGVVLSLGPQQSFPIDEIPRMVHADQAGHLLTQAVLPTPFFTVRWRWNTTRALAVLRHRGGKKVPPALQRFRADDLLTAVFPAITACPENNMAGPDIPIPDHPLVQQTMNDALHEAMDLDGLVRLLEEIQTGKIRVTAMDVREPTPFSYSLLNAQPYAFLDDAPLEERRARAVATRRTLSIESVRDLGRLDPDAIEKVCNDAWPVVRDADELHDTLLSVGLLPEEEGRPWERWFSKLIGSGRATRAVDADGKVFWVPTERWPMVSASRSGFTPNPPVTVPSGIRQDWSASEAWVSVVRGRMEIVGPTTVESLSRFLGLPPHQVESSLGALEAEGYVLRGHFTPDATDTEWCSRRLLARIHRLTLDSLRRQMEPVAPEELIRFLLGWGHLAPGKQVYGREGLLAVIEKLQGFEIPAILWEQAILPSRIAEYNPRWLDEICLSGEVVWGRVRSVASRDATKILPITLMLREDMDWLRSVEVGPDDLGSDAKQVLSTLQARGALFVNEIVSLTRLLPTQVEEVLWELVAAGRVSGDGFGAIRSLTSPMRDRAQRLRRRIRRRGIKSFGTTSQSGRWWEMKSSDQEQRPDNVGAVREPPLQQWAHQLLTRYGVFFRDLLAREDAAPSWQELLPVYRRMESSGEIRGGRFITGVAGEQFALPEVVDMLRQGRREEPNIGAYSNTPLPVIISAADPMNLVGILTPSAKIPAIATNAVAYLGGRYIGHRVAGEVWVDPKLDSEIARKLERALRSGRSHFNATFRIEE